MKRISSEIEINASPERVWQVLTDFHEFPLWNPFMRKAEGELKTGAHLKVRVQPSGGMGMTIKPTVVKVEPNSEFRWLWHLLVPGLFDSEHVFAIEPLETNRVRFAQAEAFTGVLIPIVSLLGMLRSTLRGFDAMNQALKARAEQSPEQ